MNGLSTISSEEFIELKKIESVFHSFLHLTPDFIYIKDREHRFLYVSDSIVKLAGYKSSKDIIGKTDFDIFPEELAKVYYEKEVELMRTGNEIIGLEEPYYSEGKLCYTIASKKLMYDENNEIIGLFGINKDITKRKEHADYDSLTELYNRRMFLEQSNKLLEVCRREREEAVIYFIDLNDFKIINDNHGHEAGDIVLKTIAKRLKESFRSSDLVCRFGGDEFIIFTISNDEENANDTITEHILKNVSEDIAFNENILKVSCSIGISSFPNDGLYMEKLISIADKNMYKDKNH